jgi:hypothetical protein
MANTLLRHFTGNENAIIAAMTVPLKLPSFTLDGFSRLMYLVLKWFVMLMFIPLVYRTTYRIVQEKELRTKEIMQMMGMTQLSYWLSWVFYYTVSNTLVSSAAWVVLASSDVLRHTSSTVLFLSLWLYG